MKQHNTQTPVATIRTNAVARAARWIDYILADVDTDRATPIALGLKQFDLALQTAFQ